MSSQTRGLVRPSIERGRPADAWPEDVDGDWPPDPAMSDDMARVWAECNSDLARHLASIPEPPDSLTPPAMSVAVEFAEDAFADGPEGAAAVLAGIDPGSGSAALLAMLDPTRVTPASMVGVIAATEKLASWVQALQHRWLAAFTVPGVAASREGLLAYASAPGQPLHGTTRTDGHFPVDSRSGSSGERGDGCIDGELAYSGPTTHGDADLDVAIDEVAFKVAAAEVSAALHFSPMTAQRRVRQALDFTIDLPGTLQALSRGQIDRGRALTILDRTENLPADLRHKVEAAVLVKAASRTPGQLRGIVDRAVISVDPAAAKKRQIKAREERHVTVRPERDGMSTFVAELPAEQAGVAFSVLDRVATTLHRNRDEGRRIGALRADVFSDIFDQLATHGSVDLRATLGGRAVITDDPSRFSWISDTATIAARFDPDTSLIDPQNPHDQRAEADTDAGPQETRPTDVPAPGDGSLADADPADAPGDPTPAADTDGHQPRFNPTDAPSDPTPAACESPGDTVVRSATAMYSDTTGFDLEQSEQTEQAVGVAPRFGSDTSDGPADNDGSGRRVQAITDNTSLDQERSENAAVDQSGRRYAESCPSGKPPAPGSDSRDGLSSSGSLPEKSAVQRPFTFATQQGRLTHLNVTIAASTLAGLDDLPGELDGHGPISAEVCRALAMSAASITTIAVDPSCGTALDVGRTIYRPRLSHRDYVTQRDRTCRFPGCRQPARRCQIDHSEEFCIGGATCPCNLSCLCKFHHDLKTTGLWDAQQNPDASILWTSPTGRTYRTQTPEWPIAAPTSPPEQDISSPGRPGAGHETAQRHASSAQSKELSDEPPF